MLLGRLTHISGIIGVGKVACLSQMGHHSAPVLFCDQGSRGGEGLTQQRADGRMGAEFSHDGCCFCLQHGQTNQAHLAVAIGPTPASA